MCQRVICKKAHLCHTHPLSHFHIAEEWKKLIQDAKSALCVTLQKFVTANVAPSKRACCR